MNLLFVAPPRMLVAAGNLQRQRIVCVIMVLWAHVFLFYLVTNPVHKPSTLDNRVWIQLLPREVLIAHKEPDTNPEVILLPFATLPQKRVAALPVPSRVRLERSMSMAPPDAKLATTDFLEEHDLIADAKAANISVINRSADVVQQALNAVGEIDRQLRFEHRHEISISLGMPLTPLAKGLAAAHAAVKPKWFEAARTELISGPNDAKRIYRVTTALGKYCLYFPDKGSISSNSNPKSGLADFGQPTASTCPTQF